MKFIVLGLLCVILPGCALMKAPQAGVAAPVSAPASPAFTAANTVSPSAAADTPFNTPSSTPIPTQSALPIVEKTGDIACRIRCDDFLTLRDGPSLTAKALKRLKNGEVVKVYGFEDVFARVTDCDGRPGYVISGYLAPEEGEPYLAGLDVVKPAEPYPYDRMMADLRRLVSLYPDILRLESAGKSLEGRDIPVAVAGNPGAARHVLVQAGMHAREYMTSLLMMAELEYCLKYGYAPYVGSTIGQWAGGACLHVLPMTNPDGATISQSAKMSVPLQAIYEQDKKRDLGGISSHEYLVLWKANAAGVDLNRNFPTRWEALLSVNGPSYCRYKGAYPADQPETRALMEYTKRFSFDATVSYHATGSCLYWQYGSNEAANGLSHALALAVRDVTKYTLKDADEADGGGYKDWATDALGIPSVTIEVGTRECPLPLDEFQTIWARNRNVIPAVCRWVENNR